MLVRKFSFVPIEAKIQLFKSYCYPIYWYAVWHHSCQNSIRKLTVSFSDTFKHLIDVHRYTSSSLAFVMNSTDHINVVYRKFAYILMSGVTASPNSSCNLYCWNSCPCLYAFIVKIKFIYLFNTVKGSCYSAHQAVSRFEEHHIDMVSWVHCKYQTWAGVSGNIIKSFECVTITDSKFSNGVLNK